MTDFFNALLTQAESPLWITILLSLVFALDPCAMLTNVAAIGYIGKDLEKRKVFLNGLLVHIGSCSNFWHFSTIIIEL